MSLRMKVNSAGQFGFGFTADELFIFKVWPLLTVMSQDLFPISCQFYSSLLWAFYLVSFDYVTGCLFIFSDVKKSRLLTIAVRCCWSFSCLSLFQGGGGWGGVPRWSDLQIPSTMAYYSWNDIVLFRLVSSKVSALIPWFVFIKELAYRKEKLSGQLINKKIGIKWVQQKADIPAGYSEFLNLFVEQLLSFSPQRVNWEDRSVAY